MILSKAELIATLREIADTIEDDDSFEGSIKYEMADRGMFEVGAFYRVGNSMGQGGCVIIEAEAPVLDDGELNLQTNMEIIRQEMQRMMDEEDAAEAHRVA